MPEPPAGAHSALLCAMPSAGHVGPLLAVGEALRRRGWRVRMLTGARYLDQVAAAGIEPIALPPDADLLDALAAEPDRDRGRDAINRGVERAFIAPALAEAGAVDQALTAESADVVVSDLLFFGVLGLAARPRAHRPLVVTCGIVPLPASDPLVPPYGLGMVPVRGPLNPVRNRLLRLLATRVVLAPVHRQTADVLDRLGARPLGGRFFAELCFDTDVFAQLGVPELEYPRRRLPDTVRFYGPARRVGGRSLPLPGWWSELLERDRPIVHVTQGTVANTDPTELLRPALEGLAGDDVSVVVVTGGPPVDRLGALPANAFVAPLLPYDQLLPRTACMVTNGGYGGINEALYHHIPLVVAGDSEDKIETCARVRWSGVGRDLRTGRPGPEQVRDAVRTVLSDDRYQQAARRVGAAIRESRGVDGLAADLEDAVAGAAAPGATG